MEITNYTVNELFSKFNVKCVEECDPNKDYNTKTCVHRLAGFNYNEDYTYIECYSGYSYSIKIVL
jgi:hypothetical protein